MKFLNAGKEIGFCGRPDTKVAPNLSIADMCAMAWARSNFPIKGQDIVEVKREGTSLTVTTFVPFKTEETSFDFPTEIAAVRAMRELPPVHIPDSYVPKNVSLAEEFANADLDLAALEAEMNFGMVAPEPQEPAAGKSYDLLP